MKLEVRQGRFSYGDGRTVLHDVHMEVESGQLLAILGPNGVGKTTLLRCTMGFLKWASGDSFLDGKPLRSIPSKQLWQRLSYVPQARGKASGSTVEQMVLLGRASHIGILRTPGKADYKKAHAALDRLGLLPLKDRRCDELSGGELQMVLIARALASDPECIILDEPESNLDFKNQLIVLQTLEALRRDGLACVFNTHYPDHALRYADQALMLDRAGGSRFGPTAEVITESSIAEAFGVRSVIGEVETDQRIYPGIVPLSILSGEAVPDDCANPNLLAVVSMVLDPTADSRAVNAVLHQYGTIIQGRFGMPCPERNLHIITVTVDAEKSAIQQMTLQLGRLKGVSVKATYAGEACIQPMQDHPCVSKPQGESPVNTRSE